jgi:hypothetical protein
MGYTFEDTIDELADEQAYADEKGVDLEPPAAVSPNEPRPGSEAGGPNDGSADPAGGLPGMRRVRRPGANGDRITDAVLADALGGDHDRT